MRKQPDFYKCSACGNVVDIIEDSGKDITCCGKKLEKLEPNVVEASAEKHLPVAEIDGDIITVRVGTVEHPMVDEHFIKWVSVMSANRVQRVFLAPHQKPEAVFNVPEEGEISVYEFCNIHGLWMIKLKKENEGLKNA